MRPLALIVAVLAAVVAARADGAQPRIAFVAATYGKIALLDPTGTAVRSFGPGESPAFSADGARIAFVRAGDVWTVGVDGSGLRRVTRTAAVEESPDWSPDGTLVYASNRDGRFELWTQREGGAARRLTHTQAAWQEDRSPAWSPDGGWIAFSSTRPGAFNSELYLVHPDGSGLRRLTFTRGSDNVPGDDGMPTWRPDGRGLVFVSNRDGNEELYDLELRTLKTRRLTDTPQDETLPRIGPTGRYAFVVPVQGGGSRISVADPGLRGRKVFQSGTAVDWAPRQSP